jgi:ATP:ADP antiporter, AAA family
VTAVSVERASWLDRQLRLFTVVRAGESGTALLLATNVFLLLAAYYILKPVREGLILTGGGAEVKSYAAAGQALLLLVLVPAYGVLADRLPRRLLLNVVTGFFVACLVTFYGLTHAGVRFGVVFFLWVGIFNLMVVAQFWSFANDLYTRDQGERLFPVVGFGGSLGAVVGSLVAGALIPLIGVPQLLLVAALLLVLAALLGNLIDGRERTRAEGGIPSRFTTEQVPAATGEYLVEEGPGIPRVTLSLTGTGRNPGTFRLVFGDPYLLGVALLILVLNWVNSTGEYILSRTVQAAAASGAAGGLSAQEFISRFYSGFFFAVNVTGLLLQLFVVSRLIRRFGVRVAVLVLPVIAFSGYALLAFFPVLAIVRLVKIAENATDYSLQNTIRNVLFLPTGRSQKYKAKQAIDSFVVRSGDVLSALLVYVGTTAFRLTPAGFARVNLLLALVWIGLAVYVGRGYERKAAAA